MENLKEALRQKHITVDMVATLLGIHRNTASSKVNGTTEFTVQEALMIKDSFFPEYELSYLFQKKIEQGARNTMLSWSNYLLLGLA